VKYSDAEDYPEVALKAIKKMYYQKGSTLPLDKEGRAEKRNAESVTLFCPGKLKKQKNTPEHCR